MSNTPAESYKLPSIQAVPAGQAVMNAAGQYAIQLDDAEAEPLTTGTMVVPSIFGTNSDIVCEDALMSIAPAESLQVLSESYPNDPALIARVFTIAALFPTADEISLSLSEIDGFAAVRGGVIKGTLLFHWINETTIITLCGGHENLANMHAMSPAGYPRKLLPSDLMYAMTIVTAYAAIGSNKFVLRRDWDVPDMALSTEHKGMFVVARNDIDYPDMYFGSRFPIGGKV